jgi:hypothetical protein
MTVRVDAPIPRVALTPPEAAASLGVGSTFFDAEIAPELRVIRRGRKRLYAIAEIQRWVESNGESPMNEQVA